MTIGLTLLRGAMEQRGLFVADLDELLHLNPGTVARWMGGEKPGALHKHVLWELYSIPPMAWRIRVANHSESPNGSQPSGKT